MTETRNMTNHATATRVERHAGSVLRGSPSVALSAVQPNLFQPRRIGRTARAILGLLLGMADMGERIARRRVLAEMAAHPALGHIKESARSATLTRELRSLMEAGAIDIWHLT